MRLELLGNICEIVGGNAAPKGNDAFVERGVPFVRMKDLGKYHLTTNMVEIENRVSNNIAEKNRLKLVAKGSILLPRSGSVGLNHRAILGIDAYIVSHICALIVKRNEVFNQYLYYYLTTINFDAITKKTTGLDAITFQDLAKVKVPIPALENQIHIANILRKAEALINQRKESLRLLNEFLKSTFLKMFGDPVRNEKEWPMQEFRNVAHNENSRRIPIKQSDRDKREGVYPYYGATGIIDFIDDYKFDGEYLLLAEDGKNLQFRKRNNAFIARGQFWVNNHAHVLSENNICRLRYLEFFLNKIDFGPYISGIDQVKLNKESLEHIPVPIPPIKLQNDFVGIVEKTEALKIHFQTSLQELENLYDSLSQRAFKGELQFKSDTKVVPLKGDEKEEDYFKKRKALACYIINQSLHDGKFGDTKFEKLLFLSDYDAIKRHFGQNYYQKVAGPYDNTFTNTFYIQVQKSKLFKRKRSEGQTVFIAGANHEKSLTAKDYFSNHELKQVHRLIDIFKKSDYEKPEIIATLYAVWNNRIIRQQQITDEFLKEDFLNWHLKKAKYKDSLDAALAWMRKENIVPDGWGKLIEKPKSKKSDAKDQI
jgi:restriction endonuclease S subunit